MYPDSHTYISTQSVSSKLPCCSQCRVQSKACVSSERHWSPAPQWYSGYKKWVSLLQQGLRVQIRHTEIQSTFMTLVKKGFSCRKWEWPFTVLDWNTMYIFPIFSSLDKKKENKKKEKKTMVTWAVKLIITYTDTPKTYKNTICLTY